MKTKKGHSQTYEIWRRLKKNKTAVAALIFICILVILAIFADVIADYKTVVIKNNVSQRLQPPSKEHWFGTDGYGRDVFARIVHGARTSLQIGIITTLMSVAGGVIVGSVSGYYGGIVDSIIMRICDVFMSIPAMLLAMATVAALGQGLFNLMIALTIASVPGFARIMRSQILTIRESEYVEAARASGQSDAAIIFQHIIPNAIGPLIVQATLTVASAILSAAGLSYVGLGVEPPQPEWGAMLSEAREYMRQKTYLLLFPGAFIILTALSFNLFGDGLRDAMDPRLRGSH